MRKFDYTPRQRGFLERIFTQLGLGMRAKLISLFVVIKVLPLILLALVAWLQASNMGTELRKRTDEMTSTLDAALAKTGDIAVRDAVVALDARATEDIERITTDIARRVADFLYARDGDVRLAAALAPDAATYRAFVDNLRGNLVRQGAWALNASGERWVPVDRGPPGAVVRSSITENDLSFNYRPDDGFTYESRPLFLEMTFVGLDGKEKVKVTTSPLMNPELQDVSDRRNTFVRAETYFAALRDLRPGEIYVSDVIGAYVGSRVIGTYTPVAAAKAGEVFEPGKSAYAGRENPLGERFRGLVRWAAPVVVNGRITGYVTLALDHDHLMEFTDHIIPTEQRYTEVADASEGNYAFIWDHKGRSITHARHFSIAGYDPETGDPQVPWLEDRIYDAWQASGKPYAEFIRGEPEFTEQSVKRRPAPELTRQGLVGLDCRYLNFAPQCTGWFDLTRDGGSGSFVILWSGLRKLTTAAAIPYYTGQYAASKRGFGFVTVGAGVDDFHLPATQSKNRIDEVIAETDRQLGVITRETQKFISDNLVRTATGLGLSTGVMAILVIFIAIWMASVFTRSITTLIAGLSRFRAGERHFRFNSPVKDEMGILADSFDEMADSIVASETSPQVIVDTAGAIVFMNDAALVRLGGPLEDVLGKPYADFVFRDENPASDPVAALLGDREAAVYHPETGGYFQDKASPLTHKDGTVAGYIITSTDVTDIVSGQMRIEEQRAILDTIFSSSPDLIWYKDGDGRYLMVNPRFASLAGEQPGELIGKTVEGVFSVDRAAAIREQDRRAVALGEAVYSEEAFTFSDGHEEILDVVRTPVADLLGVGMNILGVGRNVSARAETESKLREMQRELREAVDAANKANESKSEFLARMSHEIRTPMNAIIGMANIIKRKLEGRRDDPEGLLPNVRQVEISSQHLLGLLNDILDISKIEAGKIELDMEVFDLPELVATVADIIRPRCAEKNIAFTLAVDTGAHDIFVSDPLRLRQVLLNLLGNAVKFTPECGAVRFSVVCRDQGHEPGDDAALLGFSVTDTGIGMSEAVLRRLFRPFEQGDARIARQYGGTGLGLSISRSIVRLMGSDIEVRSVEGKGSEFAFSLRLQPAAHTDGSAALPEKKHAALAGRRILLVDDVAINRMIVVDLLASTGVLVEEASDGSEALDMVKNSPKGHYDIILMDVQMPTMDGYQAAAAIRALGRADTETVPIVAMTANAFRDDVEKAFASGMTGHMAKPLEFEKLVDLIAEQMGPRE